LIRHIENVKKFGVPVIVAVNQFIHDTDAEMQALKDIVNELGVKAITASHWANGGAGTEELATKVAAIADSDVSEYAPLYPLDMPIWNKIKTVASEIYRASDITGDTKVRNQIKDLEENGFGNLPICIAKTQYSFSTDPNLIGAPTNHIVPIREVRLSAGAGFIVVVCGDIMTMPGLPRIPAANRIHINHEGKVEGLF